MRINWSATKFSVFFTGSLMTTKKQAAIFLIIKLTAKIIALLDIYIKIVYNFNQIESNIECFQQAFHVIFKEPAQLQKLDDLHCSCSNITDVSVRLSYKADINL